MVQDDGPQKGHGRGLSEAPGLWGDTHSSMRSSSVVTLASLVPAAWPQVAQKRTLNILILGEDDEAVEGIERLLVRIEGGRYQTTRLTQIPLSFNRSTVSYDAALVASGADLTQGLSAFTSLRAAGLWAPVLLIAPGIEDETADRAVEFGAAEVLEAADLDAQALDRAIQTGITRQRRESRLQIEARRDDLTGLANRASFRDRLDHALTLARRGNGKVALLMIDLDGFKAVNDRLGHLHGDELLKGVGERMRGRVRESDTVARLGGDEFGVLLPNIMRREDAAVVIRKLLEAIRPPVALEGGTASITASIGVALFPDHAEDAAHLARLADAAMYRAKGDGGNRCFWHGESRPKIGPEAEDLAQSFATEAVTVALRPQIALVPGKPVVTLCPVWRHPGCGVLDLVTIRPLVEEAGLVDQLTDRLLDRAVQKLRFWRQHGFMDVEAAIPMLSRRRLAWAGLAQQMAGYADGHGIAPGRLQIAIDEQQLVEDLSTGGHGAASFHRAGIGIAIDRFGSGGAALALLSTVRPIAVRLCDEALDPTNRIEKLALFQAVASLGRQLGVRVVAVGADDPQRMAVARTIGVDAVESSVGYTYTEDSCLPWLHVSTRRLAARISSGEVHAAINRNHLAGHRAGGKEVAQGRHDFHGIAGPA